MSLSESNSPTGDIFMSKSHCAIKGFVIRGQSCHAIPILLRVIVVHGMTKFMNHDVPHQHWREEEELAVEAYGSLMRTATPPASLTAYLRFAKRQAGLNAQFLEPGYEILPSLA
jgi:hypothetical protein